MIGMTGKSHSDEAKLKMSLAHKGKRNSIATEFKKGTNDIPGRVEALPRGNKHHNWKEKPSYISMHKWISKQLGKPMQCTKCGFESDNPKRIHWANISGEYKRDATDWVRLCAKCHFKMDNISERGWITRKSKML